MSGLQEDTMSNDSTNGNNKALDNNGTFLGDHENRDVSHPEVWIMFILSLITIVGNALTFAAILSKKKLRKNPGNRFILSLCLADFCVGLFVMMPSLFRIQVNMGEGEGVNERIKVFKAYTRTAAGCGA